MKTNRQQIHQKYGGRCAYCGQEIALKDMQVDHFIPQNAVTCYRSYATHAEVHCDGNYMPACRSCNNYKSSMRLETFRKAIEEQVKVLRRDRPTFRLAERFGLIECKPKPVVFYFEKFKKD